MDSNKKNGLANLTKKATAIFGAALAALSGTETIAAPVQSGNSESKTIQIAQITKAKPMPVLKLNMSNPANSQFVALHNSHSSHRSHSSHFSHRSGAMFA